MDTYTYDKVKHIDALLDYQLNLIKGNAFESIDIADNNFRLKRVQNKIEELLEIK